MAKKRKAQEKLPVQIALVQLPLECVVYGTPATLQSSTERKADWKEMVASALREMRGPGRSPLPQRYHLRVRIQYFFLGPMWKTERDVDNIIKPILDAGKRIIYQDDKQIVEVCSQKIARGLDSGVNANPAIVNAMTRSDGEFVYISYRQADDI